jgi:hypothetical protein
MAQATKVFLMLLLSLAGFFIFQIVQAESVTPIISQIQIGSADSTKHDFIKLFNPTGNPFDLKGYRLVKRTKTGTSDSSLKSFNTSLIIPAQGYLTWANSADGFADSIGADCATATDISKDNAIALRLGAQDSGQIIDAVAWGEANNGLGEGANVATNPAPGQILVRRNNQDNDNNSQDFDIQGLSVSDNNSETVTPDQGNEPDQLSEHRHQNTVIINELVSDPISDQVEWIELFNTSDSTVDIDQWTIEDGSGAKTVLTEAIDKYLVIEKPKGNLNNAGDIIILRDELGIIIDSVTYGDWPDNHDALPAPQSPNSLARVADDLPLAVWELTTQLTKGSANIINPPSEILETKPTSKPCPIIISEVLPDPLGPDEAPQSGHGEFIELYNNSDQLIDLQDWRIVIDSQKPWLIKNIQLASGQFYQVPKNLTKFSLPNNGGLIKIYRAGQEKACHQLKYSQAEPGASWSLNLQTLQWSKPDWLWSQRPSPGADNIINAVNQAPVIVINWSQSNDLEHIQFDASDSYDPDGSTLYYHWDFGDGLSSHLAYPEHFYASSGKYQVVLSVNDGQLNADKKITINIGGSTPSAKPSLSTNSKLTPQLRTVKATTSATKTLTKAGNVSQSARVKKTSSQAKATKPVTIKKTSTANLTLHGPVIVLPNSFGSQYFMIMPDQETTAWQIYRQKGELPSLELGQIVTATGKVSSIKTAQRLLLSELSDLTLSDEVEDLTIHSIKIEQKEAYLGRLIQVTGEVTDRQGETIYLDDGSGEILVRFKTGSMLNAKNFQTQKTYSMTGLLVTGAQELELWPRSIEDSDLQKQVLGEKTVNSSTINIAPEKSNNQLLPQLLVAGVIVIIVLIILLIKSFIKNKGS